MTILQRMPLSSLLPVGLLLGAPAAAQVPPVSLGGTLLDVSAEGRVTRVPDVATIRAGVVTQGTTAAAALGDNAGRMTAMLAALKRAGIAASDIQTATVSLVPQYHYADGQAPAVTGYQATNSVAVRFHAVTRAGAILDALVAQGANQIDGPSLALDDPAAALDEARADAVKTARARAELYGRAAGLHVARIVSIAENGEDRGTVAPPGMVYAMRAKAAPTPIAPGETAVSVTLAVRFLLQ